MQVDVYGWISLKVTVASSLFVKNLYLAEVEEQQILTVGKPGSDWFVSLTRWTQSGWILSKHSEHVVSSFKQSCCFQLHCGGVNLSHKHVLAALHIHLFNNISSNWRSTVNSWCIPSNGDEWCINFHWPNIARCRWLVCSHIVQYSDNVNSK